MSQEPGINEGYYYPEVPAGTVMKTLEKAMVESRDFPSTATATQISKSKINK